MLKEVSGDILLSTAARSRMVLPLMTISSRAWRCPLRAVAGMYKDFRHYCQTTIRKPGGPGRGRVRTLPSSSIFTQEPPASDRIIRKATSQRQSCAPGVEKGTAGTSGEEPGAA